LWLRKRCRSCSSKSFFLKVKRSLFMCGHVSCSSFAAGLASVSQFVGPRLLKDTPSLVYRRSCRSTLRFARVGSVSEARRKRVETASEPSRNRVGINRVGTASGRCWPQNGPPYMLIGGLCYVGIWWCSRGSGTGSLMECPIRFLRPPKHLQLLMGRLCCGHYLPRVLFDTAPCTSSV
jgi:hypothetical protein